MKRIFLGVLFMILFLTIPAHPAHAIKFSLIAPNGTFNRGDNIKFNITVDTEGAAVNTTSVGMSYENSSLQYVSSEAGNTFPNINTLTSDTTKLLINGSTTATNTPFKGTGTYATVTFKIIASTSGSTQLCSLFTPGPTAGANPTSPQYTPLPTTTVIHPSALPKTGSTSMLVIGSSIGFTLLAGALIFIFII
jgi:hypothetical protein